MNGLFLTFLLLLAMPALGRETAVPGPTVINFRDVGGVRTTDGFCVRRGLAFRSGNFALTNPNDAANLVKHYGLRAYYDLRSPAESQRQPATTLQQAGVGARSIPMDSGDDPFFALERPAPEDWAAFYLRTFYRHSGAFAQLLRSLATDTTPAVYGCSFGKDRTGIATALLLGTLGVDTPTILADYSRSSVELRARLDLLQETWQRYGLSRDDFVTYYMTADPAILRDVLTVVLSQYGSFHAALREFGLTDAEQAQLRARFLTRDPDDCAH